MSEPDRVAVASALTEAARFRAEFLACVGPDHFRKFGQTALGQGVQKVVAEASHHGSQCSAEQV